MGETPESCIQLFKCMLKSLVKYKRKLPSIANATKEKFDYLINHVTKEDQKDFCEFDIKVSQLDVFIMRFVTRL